jgi:beta-glucanase (GH16 family)
VGWPACGEIDIMEHVGFQPGLLHGTVHTEAYNHVKGTARGGSFYRPDPYEDFHIYAVEWFEDHIDFYIDEYKYFTFKNEHTGVDTWPYDAPQYLILNLAIGGSWGGQQGVDDSIFPQPYVIDYVRVFKLKE